jgi:hypothetical protein
MALKKFIDILKENLDDSNTFEEIAYILRKMSKTSGIVSNIYTNNDSLTAEFTLVDTKKISDLLKIMGFVKKIKSDILIQYVSEIDLCMDKDNKPSFIVNFYYDVDVDGEYNEEDIPY